MKKNLIKLILLFFVSMLTVGASGAMPVATEPVGPDKDYLCITAEKADAKVQLAKTGSPEAVNLKYSTDEGSSWSDYTIGTDITLAAVGDKVYFRNANEAKDVAGFSNDQGYYSFAFSNSVSVGGNIMSLVDNNVESASIPCDSCFQRLFLGCTTLTSAADLKLPATTLTDYCYYYMFYGCTSLISAPELQATELAVACYCAMFGECTVLETVPELPATKLAMYCYCYMFGGCTALKTAPELTATALAYGCYEDMFFGCKSLSAAPELPATELAEGCYAGMFYDCTALKEAPELSATTLADGCYEDMFFGCTALEIAPELPATEMAARCYYDMFYGCTALKEAPELPAKTLAEYCYYGMFYECTALEIAPKLPATTLAEYCYYGMFNGCTSLEIAPTLPATELKPCCNGHMFDGCEKLNYVKVGFASWDENESATEAWLSGAGTKATQTPVFEYSAAELDVTKRDDSHVPEGWTITRKPDYLCFTAEVSPTYVMLVKQGSPTPVTIEYSTDDGANWTTVEFSSIIPFSHAGDKVYFRNAKEAKDVTGFSSITDYYHFFSEGPGRLSVSGNIMSLVDKNVESTTIPCEYCFTSLFFACETLTSAADLKLPATVLTSNCYDAMFDDCDNLTSAPVLPSTELDDNCYKWMFSGCIALETAPELPATELAESCYFGMFSGCKSLTAAPELPATKLAKDCYADMFNGCTSLTAAPELPATELVGYCYYYMFSGCTKLNYLNVGFTEWDDENKATYCWLSGAGTKATPTPVFAYSAGELDVTTRDDSHVPEGWTIKELDYLCFTAEEAGAKVRLAKEGSPTPVTIQYITDDGGSWTTVDFSTTETTGEITLANAGDKVYFRNASTSSTFSTDNPDYYYFSTENKVSVSGNVMSLVDKNVESTTIPCEYCFTSLFSECTTLTSAADLKLPATTLAPLCYEDMFCYCSNLTAAPKLPATTLAVGCYAGMFDGCTALEAAPELKATTLADSCYCKMFCRCESLIAAPELPATELAAYCYYWMFYGCTALETAPELPATELAEYCYLMMFYGCTALEAAPELPATELAECCYAGMFYGCEKLNYVNVGFAAWDENEYATGDWLSGAGTKATQTPVFEYSAGELDVTTRDGSHVPDGWTIKKPELIIIDDTKPYTYAQDLEDIKVTYCRSFAKAGIYEALYLPFSVTVTKELLDEVAIAQIYMVSTKGSVVGGAQDAGVNVVVVKILGVGETTDPHTPYFIRSKAGTDLEFTQEHTTLYAATEGHIDCSTTMDKYDFIGTYTGEKLTPQQGSFIYVMQDGGLHKLTTEETLPCNRWKMLKTPRTWNKGSVESVSLSHMPVITLGEDDTTGIIGIDANADGNLNDAEYNLQGQMLNTVNGYQGVVIRNGQKYLIEQ